MTSKNISFGTSILLAILLAFMTFSVAFGGRPDEGTCLGHMMRYCNSLDQAVLSSAFQCAKGAILRYRIEFSTPAYIQKYFFYKVYYKLNYRELKKIETPEVLCPKLASNNALDTDNNPLLWPSSSNNALDTDNNPLLWPSSSSNYLDTDDNTLLWHSSSNNALDTDDNTLLWPSSTNNALETIDDTIFETSFLNEVAIDDFDSSKDKNFKNNLNTLEGCLEALKDFRGFPDFVQFFKNIFDTLHLELFTKNKLATIYMKTITNFILIDDTKTMSPVEFCSMDKFYLYDFENKNN